MEAEKFDGGLSALTEVLELLPCPFCGSKAEFEYDDWNPETEEGDDGIGWVRCTNKKCSAGFHDDRDSAIEKWSTRSNAALTERGAEVVEKTTGVSPRPVEGRS